MKRFAFCLCVCFIFLMTACGRSVSTSAGNDPSAPEYTCKELCEYIVDSIELPIMDELTDKELLADIFDVDNGNYDDYCVYQQLMNVHICEIIIIRTTDEKTAAASLEARKKALIEVFSFYPEQNEAAEKTIIGRKGNYSYMIAAVRSDEIEKLLLDKLG